MKVSLLVTIIILTIGVMIVSNIGIFKDTKNDSYIKGYTDASQQYAELQHKVDIAGKLCQQSLDKAKDCLYTNDILIGKNK